MPAVTRIAGARRIASTGNRRSNYLRGGNSAHGHIVSRAEELNLIEIGESSSPPVRRGTLRIGDAGNAGAIRSNPAGLVMASTQGARTVWVWSRKVTTNNAALHHNVIRCSIVNAGYPAEPNGSPGGAYLSMRRRYGHNKTHYHCKTFIRCAAFPVGVPPKVPRHGMF